MDELILTKSVGVHDGTFHADEVTACALLIIFDLVDKDKIIRTRDPYQLSHCEFVCDVGGEYNPNNKRFDHHQDSYSGQLSSAGMILKFLQKQEIISDDLYHFLQDTMIHGVDQIDNGLIELPVGLSTYSMIISHFMPCSYAADDAEIERAFYQALDFAIDNLKRVLSRFEYIRSCKSLVAKAMESNKTYLLFNETMPWLENFFQLEGESHPALYVVMPTKNQWKLRGIPPNLNQRMQVRKPLPKQWAGLLDEDLKKISGIEGAVFCHKGGFISIWETKEDALAALEIALKEES